MAKRNSAHAQKRRVAAKPFSFREMMAKQKRIAALIVAVLGNLVGGPLVDALGASAFFCLGAGLFALALGIFAVSSRKAA